tara:strand:- start:1551 stop:2963 length:1413 start_codon:yes stop_codon:yes gene_type:complete
MSSQLSPEQPGNIEQFKISSNFTDYAVDLSAGVVDFYYYESVLSNSVTATATIMETGFSLDEKGTAGTTQGTVDGLPIRGGERTDIGMEDTYGNQLIFEDGLYVNRIRDVDPGTQQDIYYLDFASREYFANEQTRVVKRYEGSISQNVETILKDVLEVEGEIDVDETAVPYNFMGNDKKPFYIISWLASKSIPQMQSESGENATGGAAGYLFYQTRDGFHFRSIDKILSEEHTKKFLYNNTPGGPPEGYDAKILHYDIEGDVDMNQNLMQGMYASRSIYFDFFAFNYDVKEYSLAPPENFKSGVPPASDKAGPEVTEDKITTAAEKIAVVAKEFTQSPSRLMTHVLDVGTMPNGTTTEEQLENQKEDREAVNFDAANTMVQSIMRYNQMFTVKVNIIIPGDFSIKAGDIVQCDFPELDGGNVKDPNPETGGKYMVAHVCHRINPSTTTTSLALVRDSFGKKTSGTNQILE